MTEAIEGRVARILNDQELVINVGSADGVEGGMKFAVLADKALIIKDPITEEILDRIDREKVRVRAAEVRCKITICSTYEKVVVGGAMNSWAWELTRPRKEVTKSLRAEDYPKPLAEEDSVVRIGDRVVELGRPVRAAQSDSLGTKRENTGKPSELELEFLSNVLAGLAENGVLPSDTGYDERLLTEAVESRGWTLDLDGSDYSWNARITRDRGQFGTDDSIAEDYWSPVSALAVALLSALEWE